MVGGGPTRRPLWPSEDPRVCTVPAGPCCSSHPIPNCAAVEVEQRKEWLPLEGGETGGKTSVALGDSRLASPGTHCAAQL